MKRFVFTILIAFVFLTACQPVETTPVATEVESESTGSTEIAQPTLTSPTQAESDSTGQLGEVDISAVGCTLVSPRATPGPELVTLFTPSADDWSKGPEDAKVTFVEYSDFQCPYCEALTPVLAELQKAYPDDLRIIFRHFPLDSIHDKALLGVQAAEAAGKQGSFWEMHDLLFDRSEEWTPMETSDFTTWLSEVAVPELGLDIAQFEADLTSTELVMLAQQAWQDGQSIGLPGTPFMVINNAPYQGPTDYYSLETIIKLILIEDEQYTECPPMEIDPLSEYYATIETEKGDIVLELFPESAPLAVNSFIFLAENGWYDGVTFHRVMPGFVAQAGDPTGTGMGGPGYAFINEINTELQFDRAGLLAMANSGADSNGSQFFITLGPAEHLNGGYTIFGQVLEGMDAVESLTPRVPAESNDLPPGDRIISITIEER